MPTTTTHYFDAMYVSSFLFRIFSYLNRGLIWEYRNDNARLFDMDGTLIDSTAGVIGAWNLFKEKYPGLDVEQILSCEFIAFSSSRLDTYITLVLQLRMVFEP